MKIHWNILDKKRKSILPLLKNISEEGFYLAGGTGLALQMGHRDSIDFDFFKVNDFDTRKLIEKISSVFKNHKLLITQQEKNTLSCVIDETIQLSFFSYNYKLIKPLVNTEYFDIASIEDIACMKSSAIASRAVEKDYVDLYFILQKITLNDLINLCAKKYQIFDEMLILKSLSFFDDIKKEHILFKEGHKITLAGMKKYFIKLTNDYIRKNQLKDIRKSKEKGKDLER